MNASNRLISRRSFLCLAGATAAAVRVARLSARIQPQRASASLPSSIAGLPSMRDRARPITIDERRGRTEAARRLMINAKLDAIVLGAGTSLTYFTAVRWSNSERLFAVVLPGRGEPFAICPAFEADRAREQLALGPLSSAAMLTWQEDESPFARLAQGLRDRGVAAGRIGVEETMKFAFVDSLAAAAPALRLRSATPVTAGCRMIKDAHEIELMRLASEATLTCYEAVFRALHPGMTQDEAGSLIQAAYSRLGFAGEASVQVGEYTALPHGSATPQTIRDGTIVMIDDGCVVEGYRSDITRTFVMGRATDKMKAVFSLVRRAQDAARETARPGASLDAVDAAARRVIADGGFGPGFKYFTHRVGHGLGMDMHEWPYLVANNMFGWERNLTLQPGMVCSDEPGIYIPGEFGVRLEDDMYVTPDGARFFTPQSASIENPFS